MRALSFTFFFCLLAGDAGAAVLYTITDLGSFNGGNDFSARSINDAGQVTGHYNRGGNLGYQAFLYSSGTMSDLGGTLGGPDSIGQGINNSGQVTGFANLSSSSNSNINRAFINTNGVMTDLGTVGGTPELARSYGYGINDSGQVAGWSTPSIVNGTATAFIYSNGVMTSLGTLGGNYSYGYAINNAGQVTGYFDGGAQERPFLYSPGVGMTDLGTLGGDLSYGRAINDLGQVTGNSLVSGNQSGHAFLYTNSVLEDLGTLGGLNSIGTGINNAGQVVGYSTLTSGRVQAFLYSGGTMLNLNGLIDPNSGWELLVANDINNKGQIVGEGHYRGVQHSFLLTLRDGGGSGTVVPEPKTVIIWGIGFVGMLIVFGRSYRGRSLSTLAGYDFLGMR